MFDRSKPSKLMNKKQMTFAPKWAGLKYIYS